MTAGPRGLSMVAYDLPLRRDLLIRVVLPIDFTEEDAERLCGIIRTLAMPAATLEQAREKLEASIAAVLADEEEARLAALAEREADATP